MTATPAPAFDFDRVEMREVSRHYGRRRALARASLTWTAWLVAAAPLALFVCAGTIVLLVVIFRPDRVVQASHERVNLQFAVLGPPSRRELTMIAVLCLTVGGWIAAPSSARNSLRRRRSPRRWTRPERPCSSPA